MAVTVLVVADRGRFSWALINRTAVKKKKGGGGGGGGKYLSGPIDTKRRGCCTFPCTFGLDTKSGPQRESGRPRYQQSTSGLRMIPYGHGYVGPGLHIWLAISYIFTRLQPN